MPEETEDKLKDCSLFHSTLLTRVYRNWRKSQILFCYTA